MYVEEPAKPEPEPELEPEPDDANVGRRPQLSTFWKSAIGASLVLAAVTLVILLRPSANHPANTNQSNANNNTSIASGNGNRVISFPFNGNQSVPAPTPVNETPDPAKPEPIITQVRLTPEEDLKLQQPQNATVAVRRVYTTAVAVAFPLLLFGGFLLWEAIRRMQLRRKYVKGTPLAGKLKVKGVTEKFFNAQLLRTTSQQLRRHRPGSLKDITVEATIQEAARKGGLLTLMYAPRKSLPEYLVLIDSSSQSDHQARLQDELINRLIENDVILAKYYFSGDPRICRSAPGSQALKLQTLEALHPNHSVLIFSDGAQWFNHLTGRPQRWLDIFSAWPVRALFTHVPPEEWGQEERELSEAGFAVLPATEYGLEAFVRILQTGKAPHIKGYGSLLLYPETLKSDPERWIENDPPNADDIEILCVELQYYLGLEGYYWLAACALYPRVQWEITIYLGQRLTDRQEFEQRLSALSRLPWFRHSTMPEWLRTALVFSLPKEQERKIREALKKLLLTSLDHPEGFDLELVIKSSEQPSPRPDSLLDRAVKFVKRINDKLRLRAFLRVEQKEGRLRDYVFLSFLSGQKPDRLSVSFPKKLFRLLFPGGHSVQGLRRAVLILFAVLLSVAGWWFTRPQQAGPEKETNAPSFKVTPSIGVRGEQPTVVVFLADPASDCGIYDLKDAVITAPPESGITVGVSTSENCRLSAQLTIDGQAPVGVSDLQIKRGDSVIGSFDFSVTDNKLPALGISPGFGVQGKTVNLTIFYAPDTNCIKNSLKAATLLAPPGSGILIQNIQNSDCELKAALITDRNAPVGKVDLTLNRGSQTALIPFAIRPSTTNGTTDLSGMELTYDVPDRLVQGTEYDMSFADNCFYSFDKSELIVNPKTGVSIGAPTRSSCSISFKVKIAANAPPGNIVFTLRDPNNKLGDFQSSIVKPDCPTISVACPDNLQPGSPVTFTANIEGGRIVQSPKYHWSVYFKGSVGDIFGLPEWINQTTDVPSVTAAYPITQTRPYLVIELRVDGYNCPLIGKQTCTIETNPQKTGRLQIQFQNVENIAGGPIVDIVLTPYSSPDQILFNQQSTFENVNLNTQRELTVNNLAFSSYSLSIRPKTPPGTGMERRFNLDKDVVTQVIDVAKEVRIYPIRLEVTYKEVLGLNRFRDENRRRTIDATNIINALYQQSAPDRDLTRQQPPRYEVTVRAFNVRTNEEMRGVDLYYMGPIGPSRAIKMPTQSPSKITLDAGSYSFFAGQASFSSISPLSNSTQITLGK